MCTLLLAHGTVLQAGRKFGMYRLTPRYVYFRFDLHRLAVFFSVRGAETNARRRRSPIPHKA